MAHFLAVTCIRHGLTRDNAKKRYIGWSNPSLSEEGKRLLANSLPSPSLVITSDLKRCYETAQILFPHSTYEKMEEWREMHFGDWERKTYDELKHLSHYRDWINSPFEETPPNGEQFYTFKNRIWKAWDRTIEKMEQENLKHVVVITHGGPLRLLASAFVPSVYSFWGGTFGYGEGCTFIHTVDSARRKETCISYSAVHSMERENG